MDRLPETLPIPAPGFSLSNKLSGSHLSNLTRSAAVMILVRIGKDGQLRHQQRRRLMPDRCLPLATV